MDICHYKYVDKKNISSDFVSNQKHRCSLTIPLLNRTNGHTLCVIGQNPSNANNQVADKTLYYIERYVYENMPQYSKIVMLNLYSRVDTQKEQKTDLLKLSCARELRKHINAHQDFLILFGIVKNQGAYKFVKRARQLKKLLNGKNVMKIDISSKYAPHPGNPEIYYGNYCHGVDRYTFSDL